MAEMGGDAAPPPRNSGAPILVRTAGGREAKLLEKRGLGYHFVELDENANDEGGAYERKSLRSPHNFAPGQEHLLAQAPLAKPQRSSPRVTKSTEAKGDDALETTGGSLTEREVLVRDVEDALQRQST